MVSLVQRASSAVKAWNNPQLNKPSAMKYNNGGWSLFDSLGGTSSRTGNITYSENGAAQAYGAVTGVQAAVRFYMDAIGLLKLQVKSADDVLWDSTQPVPKDGNAFEGATLVIAMHDYRLQYFHDYLSSIIFSDMLYAETYTFVAGQSFGTNTALRWLNPLAVEPDIRQGKIAGYRYNWDDGYKPLDVDSVAYRIYNRNPFDDNRGLSRVLTALDAINIERNAKKAIGNFFSNGMILGGVASPPNTTEMKADLIPQEMKRIEDSLRRNNSGTGNAHKWLISPVALDFEQFEADTMDKHYDIVKSTRTEVMMALGVPKELVGDSEGVSYENAEPVMKNWLKIQGRAYATSQLDYINLDLLPMFEESSDAMFSYDFSVIDRRDADKVVIELNSGIITLDDASVELGKESDSDIASADIRIINGVPFSKDHLLAVASGQVQTTTTRPDGTSIPSGNGEDNETQALGDIPTKEVFGYHIDAGIVDINEARAQIGLKPKAEEAATDLQALQAQFAVMSTARQAGIDVGIAALMVGLTIPSETPPPELEATIEVPFQSDKHVHTHSHDLNVAKFEPNHDTPEQELKAWSDVIFKNHKRIFEPVHLRGDLGDIIQSGLDTASGDRKAIRAVFGDATKALGKHLKDIQATRLEFEGDFEELLDRARTENNFGRTQWASAMRVIGKRYGKKAYSDGLIKGGIEDGATNEADKNKIVELTRNISPHVTALGDILYKGDGISDTLADGKAAQWYNKSINPFFQAGLLSADSNSMYEWAVGATEHCTTCIGFNGQRHRLRAWERNGLMPQSDGLECKGFNCKCTLNKVKAKARGKF